MKKENFTDCELLKIDRAERTSKLTHRYRPKHPDTVIRCLNEINDNLGIIITEIRRLHDTLDYILPPSPPEKNKK